MICCVHIARLLTNPTLHILFSQVGFSDGNFSYSLLPGTNASNSFNYSYYYLDSGYNYEYVRAASFGTAFVKLNTFHTLLLFRLLVMNPV